MFAIRSPFAARRHAAGRARAISGKPASPLVLRYPVTGGDLYVGIDGAPQLKRPGNGGAARGAWAAGCGRGAVRWGDEARAG
eukprot:158793-Chlamydomonas_euryale.AAC.8